VPPVERPARIEALRAAGVAAVMSCWRELADLLVAGNRTDYNRAPAP